MELFVSWSSRLDLLAFRDCAWRIDAGVVQLAGFCSGVGRGFLCIGRMAQKNVGFGTMAKSKIGQNCLLAFLHSCANRNHAGAGVFENIRKILFNIRLLHCHCDNDYHLACFADVLQAFFPVSMRSFEWAARHCTQSGWSVNSSTSRQLWRLRISHRIFDLWLVGDRFGVKTQVDVWRQKKKAKLYFPGFQCFFNGGSARTWTEDPEIMSHLL